jgi:hypothetical protein
MFLFLFIGLNGLIFFAAGLFVKAAPKMRRGLNRTYFEH